MWGGSPDELAYIIPWPGEQSPRKAVGLLRRPKVPRHQRSDGPPARVEETVHGHEITVLLRANNLPYRAVSFRPAKRTSSLLASFPETKKNCTL